MPESLAAQVQQLRQALSGLLYLLPEHAVSPRDPRHPAWVKCLAFARAALARAALDRTDTEGEETAS